MSEFQQLKEALDRFEVASDETIDGIDGVFITPMRGDDPVHVFNAGMSYLALLQECDQCGGKGQIFRPDLIDYDDFITPECSVCSGRGMVVSDQAVEKGAKALFHEFGTSIAGGHLPSLELVARAVLAAAICGEEEE